jgi:hypothetical protein
MSVREIYILYCTSTTCFSTCSIVSANHEKISIMVVTQNAFPRDKHKRDITTNLTAYLLLRNRGDLSSLRTLSQQLTAKTNFFPECMQWMDDHMKEDNVLKYLLINLHGQFPLDSRFVYSTQIFPVKNADGTYSNPRPIFFLPS